MKKKSLKQNLLQKQRPLNLTRSRSKSKSVSFKDIEYFQMSDPKLKYLLELEGQCKITTLKFLKFSYLKTILLIVPVIISIVGLWFWKHSTKFKAMVFFSQVQQQSNATHVWIIGNQGQYEEIQSLQRQGEKSTFFFMKLQYEVIGYTAYPLALKYHENQCSYFTQDHINKGLDTENLQWSQKQFGLNIHQVDVPSYFWYMLDIMTKPFFLIQYVICIMFILQKITIFAILLFGSTFITTTLNYILLYVSYLKVKQIAQKWYEVKVVRDGKIITIGSDQLFTGDIMIVEKNMILPCDCILVSGQSYVNEASLTGQSVPVGKYKLQSMSHLSQNNRWLFQGSNVLDCRNNPRALVINTGYRSKRGRIIRKISNRVPVDPEMFKTAIYFLLQSLAVGIIVYLATLPILLAAKITPQFRIYRFLDFVGFSFPPTFPIYFNLSYSFALYRLRKKGVFGTQPHKTIQGAFLKTICFDKTGTLTQNKLQIQGVYAFRQQKQEFLEGFEIQKNLKDPLISTIYDIFSSCHSVKYIDGQYLGDEVDLKMFQAINGQLEVPQNSEIKFKVISKRNLNVVKINEFESKYQHMSALIQNTSTKTYSLLVKGAPQKIHNCSVKKYPYFDALLKRVSLNGLRSIGMAFRQVTEEQATQIIRSEIPRNLFDKEHSKQLKMIGLVTFENKLKQDTEETIRKVADSNIQSKIITGDNIFIAIQTAFRAGILQRNESGINKVVVIEGKQQQQGNQLQMMIQSRKFKAKLLEFKSKSNFKNSELILQRQEDIILNQCESYMTQALPIAIDNEFLKLEPSPKLPDTIKIYARITPQNKALIVKKLKSEMNQTYENLSYAQKFTISRPKIGMVGDGANDLMALKQADVGLGISETDASYGACFSIEKLMNVQDVIRESKSTATIVVECLRYYGTISFLKITCAVLMMTESTYFSASQLSYFNFTSTLIIPIAITLGSPSSLTTPLKPLTNMLSFKNHLIYWGNIIIPSIQIVCGYVYLRFSQSFIPNPVPRLTINGFYTLCQTTTVVFLLVQVPFALNGFFLYNNGTRFKEAFYRNYVLLTVVLINFVADIAFFFKTQNLTGFLGLVEIPKQTAGILVAITAVGSILTYIFNWWVQAKQFEQKAFQEEYPHIKIQSISTKGSNKILNENTLMNQTEALQIPSKQKMQNQFQN